MQQAFDCMPESVPPCCVSCCWKVVSCSNEGLSTATSLAFRTHVQRVTHSHPLQCNTHTQRTIVPCSVARYHTQWSEKKGRLQSTSDTHTQHSLALSCFGVKQKNRQNHKHTASAMVCCRTLAASSCSCFFFFSSSSSDSGCTGRDKQERELFLAGMERKTKTQHYIVNGCKSGSTSHVISRCTQCCYSALLSHSRMLACFARLRTLQQQHPTAAAQTYPPPHPAIPCNAVVCYNVQQRLRFLSLLHHFLNTP